MNESNLQQINARIEKEATVRASARLEGFSILPLIEPLGLDLEMRVEISDPDPPSRGFRTQPISLSIRELDDVVRTALADRLAQVIAARITTQLSDSISDKDLSQFKTE